MTESSTEIFHNMLRSDDAIYIYPWFQKAYQLDKGDILYFKLIKVMKKDGSVTNFIDAHNDD